MTEISLKYTIGWFLVVLHIIVILLAIGFFIKGGFTFDQLTTLFAVIVPMFAGYTTAIVTFVVNNRFVEVDPSKLVNVTFVVMSFLFPSIFSVLIIGAVTLQAFSVTFENFEQFKHALILIEGLFAIYVGRFIYALFERIQMDGADQKPPPQPSETTSPPPRQST